jgi:hypothetical protein
VRRRRTRAEAAARMRFDATIHGCPRSPGGRRRTPAPLRMIRARARPTLTLASNAFFNESYSNAIPILAEMNRSIRADVPPRTSGPPLTRTLRTTAPRADRTVRSRVHFKTGPGRTTRRHFALEQDGDSPRTRRQEARKQRTDRPARLFKTIRATVQLSMQPTAARRSGLTSRLRARRAVGRAEPGGKAKPLKRAAALAPR